MHSPEQIRASLIQTCQERGKQAEIARILDIAPSTVKRWIDGGEIPPVMLKVLAWILFGEAPERLSKPPLQLQSVLDFEADEWAVIEAMARREGSTPAQFIAGRVRAYLAYYRQPKLRLRVAEDPADYPTPAQEAAADRIADEVADETRPDGATDSPGTA